VRLNGDHTMEPEWRQVAGLNSSGPYMSSKRILNYHFNITTAIDNNSNSNNTRFGDNLDKLVQNGKPYDTRC